MPSFDGLIRVPDAGSAVLKITGTENDPVARAAARDRRVRAVISANPNLAVRIGGRLFILDQRPKLLALAEALGVTPMASPAPKRRKAAVPASAIAA